MNTAPKEKSRKSKKISSVLRIVFFFAVSFLALFYVLKDNPDPKGTFERIQNVEFFPLILSLLVVVFLTFLDGISLTALTRIYEPSYKLTKGFLNAFIGSFFSSFNKASSQVVQAYTLSKQGVKSNHLASILTMNFILYQLSLTLYSSVMILIGYPIVKDIPVFSSIPIVLLSLIALTVDVLFLVILLLIGFCHPFHQFLLSIGFRFLSLFAKRIDIQEKKREWTLGIATYHIETRRLFRHIGTDAFVLVCNLIRQVLINSLPFLVYWCMKADLSLISFGDFLCGSSALNLITSIIPTGAPEIGFQAVFTYFYPGENSISLASAAVLVWRFLTFYFNLIVGGLIFFFYHGSPKDEVRMSETHRYYDLELENYETTVFNRSDGKPSEEKDESPVLKNLTVEDIQKSFLGIKRTMMHSPENKEDSFELSRQKADLAKVFSEAEELRKEKDELDREIQKEADQDLEKFNHIGEKKEEKSKTEGSEDENRNSV